MNRTAHLACYVQDETGAVQRFFPNRFSTAAKVSAGEPLQIPGRMPFKLVANSKGLKERVLCVASGRELLGDLPARVVGTDFERLPVRSLEEVVSVYESVTGTALAARMIDVIVR